MIPDSVSESSSASYIDSVKVEMESTVHHIPIMQITGIIYGTIASDSPNV